MRDTREIWKRCGHLPHEERPEQVKALAAFLDRTFKASLNACFVSQQKLNQGPLLLVGES